MIPTLQGALVTLRPLLHTDARLLVEAAADGALWSLPFTVIPSSDTVDGYIDKALRGQADATVMPFAITLKSFGVDYVPSSQDQHRLTPDDPVVLDSPFKTELFEGDWECVLEHGPLVYTIKADGTFASAADLNESEPVTSEGRWAIRGKRLVWDVWK